MPHFVVLLRGVNVGKARRVPMAGFRDLLAGLGFTEVVTLLNSGNAVFRAPGGAPARHAARIADALATDFDLTVPVVVKSAGEMADIVAGNPFEVGPEEHSRFLVAFTPDARSLASLEAVRPLVVAPERFAIGEKAAYLLCASGILESRAGEALIGKAGRLATTRNWATTLKLNALVNGGAPSRGT